MCLASFLASDTWQALTHGEDVNLFYINEDVLFSPCMLSRLNASRIWYNHNLDVTQALSGRQGWWWNTPFSSNGTSLREAMAQMFSDAYGLMAERVRQRLQGGSNVYPASQGDVYYIPSHLLKRFTDLAHQAFAHYIMNEVAVSNILGLIQDETNGVSLVPVVVGWYERPCMTNAVVQMFSLDSSIVCSKELRECFGPKTSGPTLPESLRENFTDLCQHSNNSVFAVHAFKLSDNSLAAPWLVWWQSRRCLPSLSHM